MLSSQYNSVQLLKSYARAKMIKPILVTFCELSGWYFLNIAQPSLLLSSPCHLQKPCFAQNIWQWIHSNQHSWTANFDITIDFKEVFIQNSSNQKKHLYRLLNLYEGHHLWFIDGFKLICSARSMGHVFTVQIWIVHINIVECKVCQ